MAEGVDHSTIRDAHAGAEDDIGLDRHVAAELGVPGEPHRLGRDQRGAIGHRLRTAATLPVGLEPCHLGAAIGAGDFPRLGLDHRRRTTVLQRQHDDVGQVEFAGHVLVVDALEQRPEIDTADRHQPRIAEVDGALGLVGVLILDHLGDRAMLVGDDAAVGKRIVGAEAQHHRHRPVMLVQAGEHLGAGLGLHHRHVAVEDEHVAVETRQHRLGLLNGVGGAELRFLQRHAGAARRDGLLHLFATRADDDDLGHRAQRLDPGDQMHQHRPARDRVQHLVEVGLHARALAGSEDHGSERAGRGVRQFHGPADATARLLIPAPAVIRSGHDRHRLPDLPLPHGRVRSRRHAGRHRAGSHRGAQPCAGRARPAAGARRGCAPHGWPWCACAAAERSRSDGRMYGRADRQGLPDLLPLL